jgi:hypothetical protein
MSSCDFKYNVEFYRHAIGKAGDADDQPNRCFFNAKDIAKQVRDSIRDPGLIEEISVGCDEDSEPDDTSHSVERTQMLFCSREDAQSRSVSSVSSSFGIELFPQSANVLRLVVDYREHPAKEEQVTCLYSLYVSAKRRRRGWKLNTQVLQAAIRASRR